MDAKTTARQTATNGDKSSERKSVETVETVGGTLRRASFKRLLIYIDKIGEKRGENRRDFRRFVPIIRALAAVSSGARRGVGAFLREIDAKKKTSRDKGERRGEKNEKNFGSALYKGEVCVIITNRVAEVAELADALGSGPSPRNWGWRFESSLRHSFKSSFSRRTLFLFLDGGWKNDEL